MDSTWILVADRSRARVFTVEQPRGPLVELSSHDNPESRQHERDLVTDRPGREADRSGTGRSALEAASAKEGAAARFARELADVLEKGRAAEQFKRLYLVAAPHFLGTLREVIDDVTQRRVEEAIAKDVVHETPERIRKHLPERIGVSLA